MIFLLLYTICRINLKSRMVTPPAVLLLFMVVLSILGYFCFQMKFKIIFNFSEGSPWDFGKDWTKCVDWLLLVLISMVSVVMSPSSSLILLIWIFFLHLLVNLDKGLSSLSSRRTSSVSLCLSIGCCLYFIGFNPEFDCFLLSSPSEWFWFSFVFWSRTLRCAIKL